MSLAIAVNDIWLCVRMMSLLSSYVAIQLNFEQNIEHNRLEKKNYQNKKIGEKKAK